MGCDDHFRKVPMPKKDATDGERLCTHFKKEVIDRDIWPTLRTALSATGRDEEWAIFVEEVVSTHLTGRVISAGASIAGELGGRLAIDTLEFKQRMRNVIDETTQYSLGSRKAKDRVFDLTTRAVRATFGSVAEADDRILRAEADRPFRCFLCNRKLVMVQGQDVQYLSEEDRELAVEYEHVWPRSYGGNTVYDNLALSCHGCNQRKSNFANWAMVDVQSLILGWNPSDDALQRVAGGRRFALISRKVFHLAHEASLTLKQAHLRIQSRITTKPQVRRRADTVDFFNLTCLSGDD